MSSPVSSFVSRMAVSAIVSPGSIAPPGIVQYSLSLRRIRRIAPEASGTTADAAGIRLLAAGASGSLKCSMRANDGLRWDGRCPHGLEVPREIGENAVGAEPTEV